MNAARFTGKVAIVTGAASGIGLATARCEDASFITGQVLPVDGGIRRPSISPA